MLTNCGNNRLLISLALVTCVACSNNSNKRTPFDDLQEIHPLLDRAQKALSHGETSIDGLWGICGGYPVPGEKILCFEVSRGNPHDYANLIYSDKNLAKRISDLRFDAVVFQMNGGRKILAARIATEDGWKPIDGQPETPNETQAPSSNSSATEESETTTPGSASPSELDRQKLEGRINEADGTIDAVVTGIDHDAEIDGVNYRYKMHLGPVLKGLVPDQYDFGVGCLFRDFPEKDTMIKEGCKGLALAERITLHYVPGSNLLFSISQLQTGPVVVDVYRVFHAPIETEQLLDGVLKPGSNWSRLRSAYQSGDPSSGYYVVVDRDQGDKLELRCVGLSVPRDGSMLLVPGVCPSLDQSITVLTTDDHAKYYWGVANDSERERRAHYVYLPGPMTSLPTRAI